MHRYFIINKPYDMVSQFISPDKVHLLGELDFDFPEGTHAIGRLDNHSEGLLILTTNKKVTKLLFESEQPHERTYLVMVRGEVTQETLEQLRNGVMIKIKENKDYITTPVEAHIVERPPNMYPRAHDLSEHVSRTWMTITLTEGKFHQVRKMCAAVGHQCKRLIRISIEDLLLGDMQPGEVRELDEETFFRSLRIKDYANFTV